MGSIRIVVALGSEYRQTLMDDFAVAAPPNDGRPVTRADLIKAITHLNAYKAIATSDADADEQWVVTFERHPPQEHWAILTSLPDQEGQDGRIVFSDGGNIEVMTDIVEALVKICGPQVIWPDSGDEPIVVAAKSVELADHAEALIAAITSAFPAERPHRFDPMVNSVLGVEPPATAEAFADKKDWTKLEAKWLDMVPDGFSTALHFLSDEALCYYLPAFLVADVQGGLKNVDVEFTLTRGFEKESKDKRVGGPAKPDFTWTAYYTKRWEPLTQKQAEAVVLFLEWSLQRVSAFEAIAINEALINFWRQRASVT